MLSVVGQSLTAMRYLQGGKAAGGVPQGAGVPSGSAACRAGAEPLRGAQHGARLSAAPGCALLTAVCKLFNI